MAAVATGKDLVGRESPMNRAERRRQQRTARRGWPPTDDGGHDGDHLCCHLDQLLGSNEPADTQTDACLVVWATAGGRVKISALGGKATAPEFLDRVQTSVGQLAEYWRNIEAS